jgi:RimJ/RimL family protein N-acetyltransferase
VGYRSHPDARGRGYVSRALRLVIAQAFTPVDDGGYGLERLSLGAGDGNVASQAVARACGFTETGRDRRSYRLADDTVVDLVRFDLLREEWR